MKEGNLSFSKKTFPSFHDFSNLFDIKPTSSLKEDINNNALQFRAALWYNLWYRLKICRKATKLFCVRLKMFAIMFEQDGETHKALK